MKHFFEEQCLGRKNSYFFFFLYLCCHFKIVRNWKTYFINYKLQTNKKEKKTVYLYPSLWLLKTSFAYSLGLPLSSPQSETESDKVSNSFSLQNIFNLLPFLLVNILFFLFIETFSSTFLTFVISLIKDSNVDDSDLLEL